MSSSQCEELFKDELDKRGKRIKNGSLPRAGFTCSHVAETKPFTPAFPRLNPLLQVANGSLLRTSPQRLPIHPSDDPTICYVHSGSRRASLLSTRHRPRRIDVHRSILPPARFGLEPLSEWLNTIGDGCVPDFQVASLDGIHSPPVQARFKTCGC